jgi:hypothetical protein
MKCISIGIDNGLNGAVVAINEQLKIVKWVDTPTISMGKQTRKQYAEAVMARVIRSFLHYEHGRIHVFIEHAQAMPKQGVSSTFKTGEGYGLWRGICVGLGVRYSIIHPRVWQKQMHQGTPQGDTKKKSIVACQRLFPDLPVLGPRGGTKDGRADAALIAAYGLQQVTGRLIGD